MTKKKYHAKMDLRRRDVINLRVRGMSYAAIAEALNEPRSTVWNDVRQVCEELKQQQYDGADELRTQAAYRLEQLMDAYYPKAMSGDYKSAELVLKITRDLATLFSLNMPEQSNISIDDTLRVTYVGSVPDIEEAPQSTDEPEPATDA